MTAIGAAMGKVAAVLDCYRVAINKGAADGIEPGAILAIASEPVHDPETGELLGNYEKLRVKVTHVYPRFSVAETYWLKLRGPAPEVTVNVGDEVAQLREEGALS